MRASTAAKEHAEFEEAVAGATAEPNTAGAIKTMMALACEARTLAIRRWAAAWLLANCDITVVFDDIEEVHHAAPPEAANIR